MTNLLTVLPDFDLAAYNHILPSLERALVSSTDLLTSDAFDVAKRAQVPPGEVKKLQDALLRALHGDLKDKERVYDIDFPPLGDKVETQYGRRGALISTLDDRLDATLGGGIALGHLSEVVGESAAGKTQLLLTLLLSAQLLRSNGTDPTNSRPSALYISTEAPLQTTRLTQILDEHPKLAVLPAGQRPSLSHVQSTHVHDVEAQEHILRYQVPVLIGKHNVKLVVIDSIAANYRAEFDKGGKAQHGGESLAKRTSQVTSIGTLLRRFAQTYDVAIVVANQVADRFSVEQPLSIQSQSTQGTRPGSQTRAPVIPPANLPADAPAPGLLCLSTDDPLALDHQQQFFTGWGDDYNATNLKTPSLGLGWTNQLSARIALLKEPLYEDGVLPPGEERNVVGWRRSCKVVFSAWCASSVREFDIWAGGIRSLPEITGQSG